MSADLHQRDCADLAHAAAQGDLAAFEQLVTRHRLSLYRFLVRLTPDRHEAEDVTQEAFVRAFRNIGRFDPRYSFKTWLFTIARRLAIDAGRRRRETAMAPEHLPQTVDPALAVPAQFMGAETAEALRRALDRLPDAQRQALWLFYVDELSVRDVAAVMRRSGIGTRVLLHRARRAFARAVGAAESAAEGGPLPGAALAVGQAVGET